MRDLDRPDIDRALADIALIREQMASRALFQGFGPAVIAASGVIAAAVALTQTLWPESLAATAFATLLVWIATAVVVTALIAIEMRARARRHHGGLADAMILNALEQFLPAGAAGVALMLIVASFAPDLLALLPGLWQMLVALGVLAALRTLPRGVALVGAWYFLAGATVLILALQTRSLSPWMMGAPFALGQLLMAGVLRLAENADQDGYQDGADDGEA